jgi:PAS domain S-box-containing protein
MLRRFKQPIIITVIYLLIGILWLFVSTSILNSIVEIDVQKLHNIIVWVRLSFIIFSALFFFLLYINFQKKLQLRFADYTTLFDNNPNPMFVFDMETKKFLAVNKPCVLKYGYTETEFLSMTIYDIRSKEEAHRLQNRLSTPKKSFKAEGLWEHQKKNGEFFFAEISSSSVTWEGREAMLIVSYDISVRNVYEKKLFRLNQELENQVLERTRMLDKLTQELAASNEEYSATNEELLASNEELHTANEHLIDLQKKIEEQAQAIVRQSEEKLNKILSSLKDVVWSAHISAEGKLQIDYINDSAAQALYGYSAQEFIDNSELLKQSVFSEDLNVTHQVYQKLLEHDEAQSETRIKDKFGNVKWISSRIWLTKNKEGKPIRIDGINTNIDEHKKAEQELIEQKDKLQRVFDNLPLMLVHFDATGNLLFANKSSENILGWTFEEMKSRNMMMELYPNEALRNQVMQFMAKSENTWSDFTMTTRGGSTIDSSWTNVRLTDGSLIGIGQDITRRNEDEKEKTNLIEQLVEQNNDVLQFSFISSHNLRGPIATLLGLMQLVEKDKVNDPQLLHILDYMEKSILRLEEVIRDLTKILEIRGLQSEPKEIVDIDELLNTVQQTLMSQLATNTIDLTIDTSAVHSFFTIRSYMHSILYNLITNAIKYRDPERKLVIEIKTFENETTYGFTVEDNGTGIDLERFHSKIFTLYQRFHTNIEGKGLGLYLIRTQLALLKGTIEVKSQPEIGSTFIVSLPRTKDNL